MVDKELVFSFRFNNNFQGINMAISKGMNICTVLYLLFLGVALKTYKK